jgi:hypothetical protein
MLSVNAALHEQAKIVWGMGPKAPSTTVPDYVCLKGYSRCCIIITGLNTTTVTGSAITLKQATAVAGTAEKALAFDVVWQNVDCAAADGLAKTTVSSNTFTTNTTNSKALLYVIEIPAETLDTNNSFDCVRVGTGDAANTTLSVTYIVEPREHNDTGTPTLITD